MTPSTFPNRAATIADLTDLLVLQDSALRVLTLGDYPTYTMDKFRREVPIITPELLNEGHYHVITDSLGRIVVGGGWSQIVPGYQAAMTRQKTSSDASTATVRAMFVSPDFARRGLGKRMLGIVERDARAHGIERLTLTATITGRRLYAVNGYRDKEIVELRLSEGVLIRGIEMEKTLVSKPVAGAAA